MPRGPVGCSEAMNSILRIKCETATKATFLDSITLKPYRVDRNTSGSAVTSVHFDMRRKTKPPRNIEEAISSISSFIRSNKDDIRTLSLVPHIKRYIDIPVSFKQDVYAKTLAFEPEFLLLLAQNKLSLTISVYRSAGKGKV